MIDPKATKNFGAIMDRTLKIIKQNYLLAFKAAGVAITTEQWVIIDSLIEKDGVSQTDLANDSFKNAPTISRIVELLVKKGLVKKHQSSDDKRQFIIFLTENGRALHAQALPKVLEQRNKGWNELSEADYEHFVRIMKQIEGNFS